MKDFNQFLLEANTIPTFEVSDDTWTFTQTKSNSEWTRRILDRTQLSNEDFFNTVHKAIAKLYTKDNVCNGNVCILMKSKFVLVLNFKSKLIITIRDSSWENIDNGKCSREWAFENNMDLESLVENTDIENEGYSVAVTYKEENTILNYTDKCECCFEMEF